MTVLILGGSVAGTPHPSEVGTSQVFPGSPPHPKANPKGRTVVAPRTCDVVFPQRVTRHVKQ
jgi:hypothetical protein